MERCCASGVTCVEHEILGAVFDGTYLVDVSVDVGVKAWGGVGEKVSGEEYEQGKENLLLVLAGGSPDQDGQVGGTWLIFIVDGFDAGISSRCG